MDVHLQGFQFEAVLARHIDDADRAEVGETGLGADGGVLRHLDGDLVPLELIRPGLDRRQPRLDPAARVPVGVAALLHAFVIQSV